MHPRSCYGGGWQGRVVQPSSSISSSIDPRTRRASAVAPMERYTPYHVCSGAPVPERRLETRRLCTPLRPPAAWAGSPQFSPPEAVEISHAGWRLPLSFQPYHPPVFPGAGSTTFRDSARGPSVAVKLFWRRLTTFLCRLPRSRRLRSGRIVITHTPPLPTKTLGVIR